MGANQLGNVGELISKRVNRRVHVFSYRCRVLTLTATETISVQVKYGSRKRTFAKRCLYKGVFAYFKEVCVGLRDFGRHWRCTACERAMTWRARRHRHVAVKRILGNWRIELEIRYQVSCYAILLQVRAHPPQERYAILRSQVLCNIHKFSLSF